MRPRRRQDGGTGAGGAGQQGGDGGQGAGSGTGTGGSGDGGQQQGQQGAQQGQQQQPPDGQTVPYSRFKEINDEVARLRKAQEDRDADDAKKRGDFEKLATTEREKREAAEQRFLSTARRAGFVATIGSQVRDAVAAYKLAEADGLLKDVKVDENTGDPDEAGVAAAVKTVLERYPYLKAENNGQQGGGQQRREFGSDRSGTGATNEGSRGKYTGRTAQDLFREGMQDPAWQPKK